MEFLRTVVAKVLVVILFGLLIASFAVWGIGDIFRGSVGPRSVAQVGDYEITDIAFSRQFSNSFNALQRNIGGSFTVDQARAIGLDRQVLQDLIGDGLFSAEAEALNMTVSDDQVREEIFAEEAFQDEFGRFSKARFEQGLYAARLSEQAFVEQLRDDIVRRQIVEATTGPITTPETLADTIYRYRAEARIVESIVIPFSSMTIDREPSEADLAAIHDEFSSRFMAPETRDLTVLSISPELMASQFKISDEELETAYNERIEELSVPETRTLVQFVTQDEEQANQILGRISAGESFESAVQSVADGKLVELGTYSRSELSITLPEAVDAVFSADAGSVAGPVTSVYGKHLILIADVTEGSTPSFEEVKESLREDLTMERSVEEMINLANKADDLLAAGATVEEAADQLDLELTRVQRIDQEGNVSGGALNNALINSNRLLQVAFQTQEGDESLLTEHDDGGYFLVRVDQVYAPAVRPLEDVRDQVVETWRAQEREAAALSLAQTYVDQINTSGVTLAGIAEGNGYSIDRQQRVTRVEAGQLNSVADALFSMTEGDAVLGQTAEGALVAVLTDSEEPDPASNPDAVNTLASNLQTQLKSDLLGLYGNALQQRFGVTVNQALVDQIVNETF